MRAAVVHKVGDVPHCEDFPDPVVQDGEVIVRPRAVAIENVDKAIVNGTHYAASAYAGRFPMIPTFDGVGELEDGSLVTFGNPRPPFGGLAELCPVDARFIQPAPEGIDPAVLAVMSSAVTAMSIKAAGELEPGQVVLVQGGTGFAGRLTIQIAKLLGAGRIVATGRDDAELERLVKLGADVTINTQVSHEALAHAFTDAADDGYDVVADYLWGPPTEALLQALTPRTFSGSRRCRLIQIGDVAGAVAAVRAASLRTSGVEIVGAGKGLNAQTIPQIFEQILTWTRNGDLAFDLERTSLADIEEAWQRTDLRGKRLVLVNEPAGETIP